MEENKKSYKKYYLLIIPIALILGFVGYWQIASIYGSGFDYETVTVKEDTLEIKVEGSGQIIAPEKTSIKPEINGEIEEVLVSKGDYVEKDQELIKIKNDELDAVKAKRWAEYLEAVDNLEKIYSNPDAPESEKKSGEANKESARLNHDLAEQAVNKKIIKSPIAGTVASLDIKVGDKIDGIQEISIDNEKQNINNTVAPIITILNLDNLEAQIEISENDLSQLSTDQSTSLTLDALGNVILSGSVKSINSIANTKKGEVTYDVNIAIEDLQNKNIKPGMSVNASININKEKNVLLVPNDVLKKEQKERYYVEVLKNNKPQKRVVKTGLRNNKYTQVLDGLKLGEEIVVSKTEKNIQSNVIKAIKNF